MDLLTAYQAYVAQHQIYQSDSKVLVAVSGGRDSMVLLDLVRRSHQHLMVAHVNYGLRPEAQQETALVKDFCQTYDLELATKSVDEPAPSSGIQLWARKVRFDWMRELGYDVILTGAHAKDQVETLLLNMVRGSGIKGGRAMLPLQNGIGHPLLFASRELIDEYAQQQQIPYLDDPSNDKSVYNRNKIRNEVLPLLEAIHPGALNNLNRFTELLRNVEQLIDQQVNDLFQGGKFELEIAEINALNPVVLETLMGRMGFHAEQTRQLIESTVKILESDLYKGYINGDWWTFEPLDSAMAVASYELEQAQGSEELTVDLKSVDDIVMTPSKHQAFFDLDKLQFPLTIRGWQVGDRIKPLGMHGTKTVGDFLTDTKVPLGLRDQVKVLCCGDQVAWIMGHRISQDFAMDANTKKVYHCKYQPQG